MAFRRELTKRSLHLFSLSAAAAAPPAEFVSRRSYIASPDIASRGFFRRILQRRTINQSSSLVRMPEFLTLPVGEKLREKLSEINIGGDRIRLDGLTRPPKDKKVADFLSVEDAKRITRAAQLEKVKQRLRSVPESTVPYSEFVQICADACGSEDQALEFAKLLDETASVIVWGSVVFLRPEQVVKTVESLITQSWAGPNDPRKKEFEEMGLIKAQIDIQAQKQVRRELYYGLGLMMAQTAGFMRLTFWELSWDVMEPICFFVTSMHFAMAYTFFLRTSTEPSFEGFFKRRFKTKQAKLMKLRNFDVEKYERLSKAFNPSSSSTSYANCSCI
ncbi:hypothetical protein V2J09_007197 [Rumex salicifolius]